MFVHAGILAEKAFGRDTFIYYKSSFLFAHQIDVN